MKTKLVFSSAIIFCLLIIFSGCSKDSVEEDIGGNYGTMQAKIGSSLMILPIFSPVLDISNDGIISIYGLKDEIGITVRFPNSIGTYQFSNDEASAKLSYGDPFDFFDVNNDGAVIDYNAIEGSVTLIETNSERIKGTFHFTGENYDGEIMTVTEGKFDVIKE